MFTNLTQVKPCSTMEVIARRQSRLRHKGIRLGTAYYAGGRCHYCSRMSQRVLAPTW
jgi:hypothetical protein